MFPSLIQLQRPGATAMQNESQHIQGDPVERQLALRMPRCGFFLALTTRAAVPDRLIADEVARLRLWPSVYM